MVVYDSGVLRWTAAVPIALFTLAGASCQSDDALPSGKCRAVVWALHPVDPPAVVGSWDEWSEPVGMKRFNEQWSFAELILTPGEYGYLMVRDGQGSVDPHQGLSTFRRSDGTEVSLLRVPDCSVPRLHTLQAKEVDAGSVVIDLSSSRSRHGAPLDPASVEVEGVGHEVVAFDAEEGSLSVRVSGLPVGKHHLSVHVTDVEGESAEATATAFVGRRAPEPGDEIIYQIMVDRFRGPQGSALQPPLAPGARAGGTLDGVLAELEAGIFDALGVSTLWLTPVYLNPDEAREGSDGNLYEGYHGYWPLQSRAVDPRLGGETALHALVQAAHARGMAVLLDVVPNHVYEANPRVAEHRGAGWFHEHDPSCVCGTEACPWHLHIEECWFTPYLPDLRHENPDVLDEVVADARWWSSTFDLDGFRIDAVPMMPRAVTRNIVHAIREDQAPDGATLHLGEIFTGPGTPGTEVIRYYLGPDGLDSAFDFPLMWMIRDVIAHRSAGFSSLQASLDYTASAIEGSGSVMATIIGNHDVTRFVSEAHGDAGADGWGEQPAEQPGVGDEDVYARQGLALGLLLTLPGMPVIYYGDEVGLAGGADPDNRRVMPVLEDLSPARVALLEQTRRLGALRRCVPALRRGVQVPVVVGSDQYAFVRDAGDQAPAVVLVHRGEEPGSMEVRATALPNAVPVGLYEDALTGERFEVGTANDDVPMKASSLRVLVPYDSPCLD